MIYDVPIPGAAELLTCGEWFVVLTQIPKALCRRDRGQKGAQQNPKLRPPPTPSLYTPGFR